MDIFFKTRQLEQICTCERSCCKQYPDRIVFKKIYQRLLELKAAPNLRCISHLPPARCHQLSQNRQGQFAVNITGKLRLIFIPNHEYISMDEAGVINLDTITNIIIIEICNYHDE